MPRSMSARKLTAPPPRVVEREVSLVNKLGMHARPASMFVKTASRFQSEVFVEKDGDVINGKSIMGLLMLAAGPGSTLKIRAEGSDASQAVTELEALVQKKFDEE
jgi:phosphocarrier protein HPr